MKLIQVQKQLKENGLEIFTTLEFQRVTGLSGPAARKFLMRYTDYGVFWQVKRGLYALRNEVHPWVVANKLYRPSYISLETALAYYGLIPEAIYGITSVTTRLTREFEACETLFFYQTIKKVAFQGYKPVILEKATVLIAEPEKALADFFYFVYLGKKSKNDRLKLSGINKKLFLFYLESFERKNLLAWGQDVIRKKS